MNLLRQCFSLIEPAVTRYETSHLNSEWPPYARKGRALMQDLQQLGANEAVVTQGIGPIRIDSTGAYLGARYVLEGSAQGGLFIARCLEKSLPDICNEAFSFWVLQRQAAEQWEVFLGLLSRIDGVSWQQQQATQASIESFDIFLSVFATVNHEPTDQRL